MKTRNYRKYTQEDKLEVIRLYEKGYGGKIINCKTGISTDPVKLWIRRYREFGLSGSDRLVNQRLSDKVKSEIVWQIRNKCLSLQSASIAY
ncbi:MAG: helix-turn-helix domain containing protein, partial [Bacteroidales bacterium]|nr:helix-turn-helix domain containing protein [Bacteroidales bacterium]